MKDLTAQEVEDIFINARAAYNASVRYSERTGVDVSEIHNIAVLAVYVAGMDRGPEYDNIDRAIEIGQRIKDIIAFREELKKAFANRGLDGGALAAYDHPLWEQSTDELEKLREALVILV